MDNQDWINLDCTEIAHKYYYYINHHIFSLFRVTKKIPFKYIKYTLVDGISEKKTITAD